ncbi:D-glycero-beta-D-manno-heptose 1,7-bisphosphate 7-phosphatase [Mesosutterella sp. OilRF-GAM-744-9]|uniref:D,D-heptose 1,7-bisphosphate phosphatase n=1 Tax=Mesosutterella porci TaxID=2915351 RepID=A0ABS9MNT7_9BURK|nr:D-glycero-beta-D-manno-heptose 1,7-bisphosphate 7-phosphatase [Mesosutterella sp. oilRF-744-WT-GAM-9]MCG5030286.1 D-glycero-beta-D-manno-heptose 1,7-bisphosphate 7-phosphatase [Mesosutterella sp. oilRF-744-WT-GAM-9]MCI6529828.1 D-glycero-beta-D-manno-heptose 1,7-bisphosphate 7-phosphatase [Mesosutterella sp.]
MKAVFLDRDGVINVDRAYVHRIEDFSFVPGTLDACRLFRQQGFRLFVVTNQSGIGRGYFSEQDFSKLTEWMLAEMARAGAEIEKVYFCPHHPEAAIPRYRKVCGCRKPAPGMIEAAIRDFGIDPARSVIFGDSLSDVQAGSAAGLAERVLLGKNGAGRPALAPPATASFRNLLEAAQSSWFHLFCRRISS